MDAIHARPLGTYCFVIPNMVYGQFILTIIGALNSTSMVLVTLAYLAIVIKQTRIESIIEHKDSITPIPTKYKLSSDSIQLLVVLAIFLITNSFEVYLELYEFITTIERSAISDLISAEMQNINAIINSLLLLYNHELISSQFYNYFKNLTNKK